MKMKKRGFTLTEMVVTLAVIGILIAILLPVFSNVIAKAHAKSALSDARNSLTAFITQNMEKMDGKIAKSVVIFVKKANMYYVFGYHTTGEDRGKLMQSAGNPYNYDSLASLIYAFNCPDINIIGTEEESNYAFYLYPHDKPSGTITLGTKSADPMERVNAQFINLTDKIPNIPYSTQVFDGFLIGMVVDTHTNNDKVTNGPGGKLPTGSFSVTYLPGAPESEVTNMPDPRSYTVKAGGSHEIVSMPLREGYDFAGWLDVSSGVVYTASGQYIQNITGNIMLIAQWTKSEVPAQDPTLTFVANGATLNLFNGFTNGSSIPRGTDINYIITGSTASKPGEEFLGWKSGEAIYKTTHTAPILIFEDMTLTAVWKEKRTLTFNANGGTGAPSPIPFYAGDTITLPMTIPTKNGFVFDSWSYSSEVIYPGGKIIDAPDKNITLTANWKKEWTVSFDIAGGAGTVPSPIKVQNNGYITLPSSSGFSRTGYTFEGWILGANRFSAGQNYGPVTSDLTFVADWKPIPEPTKYSVTYYANGGSGTMVDPNSPYNEGSTVTVLPNAFNAPAGKEFDKWNTRADGTGANYQAGATFSIYSNITLYAQWKDIASDNGDIVYANIRFYDTWNEQTISINNAKVPKGTVTATDVAAIAPEYWVFTTQQITGVVNGSTITFNGTRMAQLSGSKYVTYTSGTRYQVITTALGFNKMATDLYSRNYLLYNNIDEVVNRIGTEAQQFSVVFDGNNKSVRFSFSNQNIDCVGVFAKIAQTGVVKNLEVRFDTISGRNYVGAITGWNFGKITNCKVKGNLINANGYSVGGLTGETTATSVIEHCTVETDVFNANSGSSIGTGGFVGKNNYNAQIVNCHSTGNVTGKDYVGGFSGTNYGFISWCSATGTTVKANDYAGGFTGHASPDSIIEKSYCEYKDIIGNSGVSVAGFAGSMIYGSTIKYCYAIITGSIAHNGNASGFAYASYGSNVQYCYVYLSQAPTGTNVSWDITGLANVTSCYTIGNSATLFTPYNGTPSQFIQDRSKDAAWSSAGCWDFNSSTDYLKLKPYTA